MKKAFTLIELVVVVSIIALLAGVVIVNTSEAQKQSRDNKRKADLTSVQAAIELYYASNRKYPTTVGLSSCFASAPPTCGETPLTGNLCYSDGCTPNGSYIPGLAPTYLILLPSDPTRRVSSISGCNGSEAGYMYKSDEKDYKFIAYCTPEQTIAPNDQFNDPVRSGQAFAVYSAGAKMW